MDPRFTVRLLAMKSEAQRREEELLAWHRRPDARPLPDDPPDRKVEHFGFARRMARAVTVLLSLGRDG
jgi:hypothetical protein